MKRFASFENRKTGLTEHGCVPGPEAVSPQAQFAATPCFCIAEKKGAEHTGRLNFTWEGVGGSPGKRGDLQGGVGGVLERLDSLDEFSLS